MKVLAILESTKTFKDKIEDGNEYTATVSEYSIPSSPVWIREGDRISLLESRLPKDV